jgi:hypothetical protein
MNAMKIPKKKGDPVRQTRLMQLRMPLILHAQLEEAAERNLTNVSAEIIAACRMYLTNLGLWPPNPEDK